MEASLGLRAPTIWESFIHSPTLFLATYLYNLRARLSLPPSPREDSICIICVSDTHNATPTVPEGDILIHAGDLTQKGTREELEKAVTWLASLPHKVKIVVAGNHDFALDKNIDDDLRGGDRSPEVDWRGIIYLEHSLVQVTVRSRPLNIFGSPFTPEYGRWAFQYPTPRHRPGPGRVIWSGIPPETDILITHGPPFGHLDTAGMSHAGCKDLLQSLWDVKPALHVFGHIHAGRGKEVVFWDNTQKIYEAVVGGRGRFSHLLKLLRAVIAALWVRLLARKSRKWKSDAPETRSILVNAAIERGRGQSPNEPQVVDV